MESYNFDLVEFQKTYNLKGVQVYHALKKLEEAGYIQFNDAFYSPSKVQISLDYKTLYEFQMKHAGAEPMIKLLVRLYGGEINQNFISVSENEIARQLKINTPQVVKQLERLQELNVLVYTKQKNKPQIVFLTPRYDARHLPFDVKKMEEKKNKDLEKVRAVVRYVSHQHRCRTQLLLEYFGEVSQESCQVCDICVQKKKSQTDDKTDILYDQIIEKLQSGPLALKIIIEKLQPNKEKEILETIKKMVDVRALIYTDDGRIKIK